MRKDLCLEYPFSVTPSTLPLDAIKRGFNRAETTRTPNPQSPNLKQPHCHASLQCSSTCIVNLLLSFSASCNCTRRSACSKDFCFRPVLASSVFPVHRLPIATTKRTELTRSALVPTKPRPINEYFGEFQLVAITFNNGHSVAAFNTYL